MGYPPGAAFDSSAPYNETDSKTGRKIKDVVTDEDCNDFECFVHYSCVVDDDYNRVYINDYKVTIKKAHNIPEDILDAQVRDIIREQYSDKTDVIFDNL